MSTLPKCPQCGSEYTYVDGNMYVCPECAHEWSADAPAEAAEPGASRLFGTIASVDLDAPVERVCSAEVPMPYPRHLEEAALPQVPAIVEAVRRAVG